MQRRDFIKTSLLTLGVSIAPVWSRKAKFDLDQYMNDYNTDRTNQGKRCQGRTPMQTLIEGIPLYIQYVVEQSEQITVDKNIAMN